MRIRSLSDNFNYIGFIVFSLRRCCLDIRAGSWISLISFCDVSITVCVHFCFFLLLLLSFFFLPLQSVSMVSLPFTCLSGLCVCFCFARACRLQSHFSKSQASLPEFCPCFCVWPFLWREFRHNLSHRLVFQMVIVLLHGAGCSLQLLFSFLFFIFCLKNLCMGKKPYSVAFNFTLTKAVSHYKSKMDSSFHAC